MRASDIVRQLSSSLPIEVHRSRRQLMFALVDSLVRCRRVALTALGRGLESSTAPKHRIKRVDRFLGNSRAHEELALWYGAVARRLLRHNPRPVVLVDWTQTVGAFHGLVAAVAFSGRAIPIYAEVHPEARYASRRVQHEFLLALARLLPPKTRPIIVADAGFKTPFFRSIRDLDWDFVIRLRGKGVLRRMSTNARLRDPRLRFKDLFASASDRAQEIGEWTPYRAQGALDSTCRIVLSSRPASSEGPPRVDPYGRRAVEPWLLATTILHEATSRIVDLYRLRMQIELMFRDAKNGNLGWALEHARSRTETRQAVLLLVACLALVVVLLLGAHAEAQGESRRYQANSVRSRRVQSLFRLGEYVLVDDPNLCPTIVIVSGRALVHRFLRSNVQLRLPKTTWRYGKWR